MKIVLLPLVMFIASTAFATNACCAGGAAVDEWLLLDLVSCSFPMLRALS